MDISRGLALKSLGALGAAAAAGLGLGLENSPLRNALGLGTSSSNGEINFGTMAEKVGLNCPTDSNECSIDDGKFNVFIDSGKKLTGVLKSANSSGKIKFEENQEGYNQKFKFTIIDGDITFTNSNSQVKKLEKYETYEAKEHDGIWYFSRKSTALEEKSRALGLPAGCNIPENEEKKVKCELNSEKFKAIGFEGKKSITIKENINVELAIKKISNGGASAYAFGNESLKFTFKTTENIEINTDSEKTIKLLRGAEPEFKIKDVGNKLTLEKVWSKENLDDYFSEAFTISKGEENKWIVSGNATINAIVGDKEFDSLSFKDANSLGSLEISVEEDREGYAQGLKFNLNKDVSLGSGTNSNWEEKIKLLATDSFEIKTKDFGEERRYLSKKETT